MSIYLAEASLRFPGFMYLTDVLLLDKTPVADGSYANVYKGVRRNIAVALKALRNTPRISDRGKDLQVRGHRSSAKL